MFSEIYIARWVGGNRGMQCGLFVRRFSRRPYGTRSWLEWVSGSGHEGSYVAPDVVVVAEDTVAIGVAAVRQSTATVLRAVMLYRACVVAQGSVCAQLVRMRGYFWKWMQQWIGRKELVLLCFRRWLLQWRDQRDLILYHRVKSLRDALVSLGVGVCEDLGWKMRLVEEIVERRSRCIWCCKRIRNLYFCVPRPMAYTLHLAELLALDRVVGLWLWLVGLWRVQRHLCRFHNGRSVGSI